MKMKHFAGGTLLAMVLLILALAPIGSQQPSAQQEAAYSPWLDSNDDGTIDIYDVIPVGYNFGTSGDPTKNVMIAGHVNKLAYTIWQQVVPPAGSFSTGWIGVDGYSKMTISIMTPTSNTGYYVWATHFSDPNPYGFILDMQNSPPPMVVKAYDVPNQKIQIDWYNFNAEASWVSIDVYLIP